MTNHDAMAQTECRRPEFRCLLCGGLNGSHERWCEDLRALAENLPDEAVEAGIASAEAAGCSVPSYALRAGFRGMLLDLASPDKGRDR